MTLSSDQYNCIIASKWDGSTLPENEKIHVSVTVDEVAPEPAVLVITVDAPFYNDPKPSRRSEDEDNTNQLPHSPTHKLSPQHSECLNFDGLWNYEVVEVFIKGKLDKYIEIEMGPHGHYLILALDGYRHCFKRGIEPISYEAKISGNRWTGRLVAPIHILPPPTGIPDAMFSYNAYAIHEGPRSADMSVDTRVYCCAFPPEKAEGEYLVPDFHKLQLFQHLREPLDKYLSTSCHPAAKSLWSSRQGLCLDFASPRFTASVPKEDASLRDDSSSPTLRE